MSEIAISVDKVSKMYRLGEVGTGTLSHDLNRWWHKVKGKEDPYLLLGEENKRDSKDTNSNYVWALKDISFDVEDGQVLGIIGKNGAGKSTLLKLLSRVTAPTTGTIKAKGRIASLLEVGTGFHPELTGKENIFLNGAILGMTRPEIKRKLDEIVDFSGVARYVDTPVKRYSSGMYVRLAFAVAAFLEPEILIVDEVLAVGDAEFQKKCIGRMKDVSEGEGRTVLFVSHNLATIRSLCSHTILMENGRLSYEGDTAVAIEKYMSGNDVGDRKREVSWSGDARPSAPELAVSRIRIVNEKGDDTALLATENEVNVEIEYEVRETIKNLRVMVVLFNVEGIEVFSTSDFYFQNSSRVRTLGKYKSTCHIPSYLLNGGKYVAEIHFEIPSVKNVVSDLSLPFEISELSLNQLGVTMGKYPGGIVHPKLEWSVEQV